MPDTDKERAKDAPEAGAPDAGEQSGKVKTGLGGNAMDQSRHGASVDETMMTKGERRCGGQDVS